MVLKAVFNITSVILVHLPCNRCTCPCFPGVLLTSTPHNILSRPLAAFHIIIAKKMDSSDYHQSSEKILTLPEIEPVTCTLCSNVLYTIDQATGLGNAKCKQKRIDWQVLLLVIKSIHDGSVVSVSDS